MNVAEHIILFSGGVSAAALMLAAEPQGLAIDFTAMSMAIKDTTTPTNNFDGNPNDKLTYSSPSTKWILGANGLYSSGTALRTSYDANGNALGVLIEEARTNVILNSANPNAWGMPNLTVTPASIVGPDGTLSGSKLEVTATSNVNIVRTFSATAATTYTHSIILKKGNGALNRYAAYQGGDIVSGYVNHDTLAVTYAVGSSGISAVALPNGWIKITVTWVAPSTASANVYFGTVGDTWTAGDYVYMWNAQLETGAFATSPIVTGASTVTRAADNMSVATSLFPSLGSAGTLYVAGQSLPGNAATSYAIQVATDGSNFGAIRNDSGTTAQAIVFTGGALVAAPSAAWVGNTRQKTALRLETNNTNICSGGSLGSNDTTCTMPAYATLFVGSNNGVNNFNGYIAQGMALPRAWSNAELQTGTS